MSTKSKVIAIVGARLSSTRLPAKHLLDLAGKSLIARLFERLETVHELDNIILATTAEPANKPLLDWARTHGKSVFAYDGDVNDVVGRIDALVKQEKPDILAYICGDSPLIEPQTLSRMIQTLIDQPQADYVSIIADPPTSTCIHEGFNVYRSGVWSRLVAVANTPSEREHVSLPARKILDQLKHTYIIEQPIFSRIKHRISVDTPTDYQFMQEVYQRWYQSHNSESIVSLKWVIEQLEQDSDLRSINEQVLQKQTNQNYVKVLIVTQCGQNIGLGNLSRMLTAAQSLQDYLSAGVKLLIQGEVFTTPRLQLTPHTVVSSTAKLTTAVIAETVEYKPDVVVFDLNESHIPQDFEDLLKQLKQLDCLMVAIDGLFHWEHLLDLIYVPSFFLAQKFNHLIADDKIRYGWNCYLLPPKAKEIKWRNGHNVLILTGGSDPDKLSGTLPKLLEDSLIEGSTIHWVQGPFSESPHIPSKPKHEWQVYTSPKNISELLVSSNCVFSVYGLSLFEVLRYGIPCVTMTLQSFNNEPEIIAFEKSKVALVAKNVEEIPLLLNKLMTNAVFARELSQNANVKFNEPGAKYFAENIDKLVKINRI